SFYCLSAVAEAVRYRVAAIASEILLGNFYTRCRLTALVFSQIEQMFNPLDCFERMPSCNDLGVAHFVFDKAFKDVVQNRVRRQTSLIGLVFAQFGRWRLGNDILRDHFS